MTIKPIRFVNHQVFDHDCEACVYLGSTLMGQERKKWTDWYVCPNGGLGGSLVGRFDSEPSEYWSMPIRMVREMDADKADSIHLRLARAYLNDANSVINKLRMKGGKAGDTN
jgi:hypothetical protein